MLVITDAYLAPSAIHAIQKHTLVGYLNSQRAEEPTEPVRQSIAPKAFVMRWNLDPKHVEVLAGEQHPDGSTVGSQYGYAVSPGNATSFNFSAELHSLESSSSGKFTTNRPFLVMSTLLVMSMPTLVGRS